ncbi:MAG: efflux RND transporter periplasmic adaptor subunit [Rhodoferax sp.]
MHTALAVGTMAVLGAGAWWYQGRPGQASALAAPAREGADPKGGSQGGAAGPAQPVAVEMAPVQTLRLQDDAQAVGSLRSRQSVVLRPEVAGRVVALGFHDGATVRKGQLLVQLDDSLQRAELAQAQAQLAVARANHQRNTELVAKGFVTQRVLDESAANLQVVQAQNELAQARLARMAVRAPFDGTVGLRSVNLGDYVKDGADLVGLEDLGAMVVDFKLPERFLRKLRKGLVVEVALDAHPGLALRGRIDAIDPLLDVNGRAVSVRALLQPPRAQGVVLRPGQFARLSAVFGVNEQALVVPEEAIVPQGNKQFVVKVVEGKSQRQEVGLGVRRQGKVEVVQGLQEGDVVVLAGQQRLQKDGTPVRALDLAKAAGGAGKDGAAPPRDGQGAAGARAPGKP